MKIWLNSEKIKNLGKFAIFERISYKFPPPSGAYMKSFYIQYELLKEKLNFGEKYSPVLWRPVIGIMLQ